MAAFQKSLYDLDRMHASIKAGYEDEIKRLRHELVRGFCLNE
jgi:Tup N-terminal